MNTFNPRKLLNSKWTSVDVVNKEKHFLVIDIEVDEIQNVINCTIEAIISKREEVIDWQQLKDTHRWQQGWK